jgi:hypothetical protein
VNASLPKVVKRHERRQKQREQKERQKRQPAQYPFVTAFANRKSDCKTVDEEKEAIQHTTEAVLDVYIQLLPGLLKKLSLIPDPRNPKKIKHQITVLMIYGILMFVFQIPSRRQTNREMTTPQLHKNLKAVFGELKEMPHQDTLYRLLAEIDVDQLENIYLDILRSLIRKKKFKNLLLSKRYLVAVDGTQKYVMKECWDKRYLRRKFRGKDGKYQYYAYVLEAVLIFSNGMVLPLMSEFLENTKALERIEDDLEWKQDCELKAFHRLAKRLKKEFPKLPLTLLLDGLYANGPVMKVCLKNKWDYMIVLKDGSLACVWQEVKGLMRLDTKGEHRCKKVWQGRRQIFRWVNGIEYEYGLGRGKKVLTINVVICNESWKETDRKGNMVGKTGHHAWISSVPLNHKNVYERCNLAARKRWSHENNILKEKHHGYHYEHIFAYDFDAMRGYHYLMHIARMLNELMLHSINLIEEVKTVGIQAFLRKFREVMIHRELDTKQLRLLSESPGQLRLVQEENWQTNWPAA